MNKNLTVFKLGSTCELQKIILISIDSLSSEWKTHDTFICCTNTLHTVALWNQWSYQQTWHGLTETRILHSFLLKQEGHKGYFFLFYFINQYLYKHTNKPNILYLCWNIISRFYTKDYFGFRAEFRKYLKLKTL